jgi:hypothetical protein
MQDRITTSWRRRTDATRAADDKQVDEKNASSMRANAEKIEAWEDEGGRAGRLSSEVPRVLIVDNDMRAADDLELMLNAAG